MASTDLVAGDASNQATFTGGNDGALKIRTGPNGAKVDALSIAADGTPTLIKGPTIGTAPTPIPSGSAPIYGCRAWVSFVGATAVINASGNVTSVTRNGAGDYTINFTTAMPDANYAISGMTQIDTGGGVQCGEISVKRVAGALTANSARIATNNGAQAAMDVAIATVCFFR